MISEVTGGIFSLEFFDLFARRFERTATRIACCQCHQIVTKNRKVLYIFQHIFTRLQHFGKWSAWVRYQKSGFIPVNTANVCQ